jgi:hypothetical protein
MPKAKKPMMPAFAGFGMDPSGKKMSARYTISMTINPADFGLTGSEDNNTMAAAVVKVLETQGAAAERAEIVDVIRNRAEMRKIQVEQARAGLGDWQAVDVKAGECEAIADGIERRGGGAA